MREVPIESWGQALLEEVLFRAGTEVSEAPHSPAIEVTLTVRLESDVQRDRIEITVPSTTDTTLVTHLPRPS